MKLLIQKDIESVVDHVAYIDEIEALCKQYGIRHTYSYQEVKLKIFAQKVNLDEIAMNDLIVNGLYAFSEADNIKLAPLGGKGCEICLMIE